MLAQMEKFVRRDKNGNYYVTKKDYESLAFRIFMHRAMQELTVPHFKKLMSKVRH